MGDEADAIFDQMYDYWAEFGDDEGPREAECRLCGKGGLTWSQENGLWKLYEVNDRKHVCDSRVRTRRNLKAFDKLD